MRSYIWLPKTRLVDHGDVLMTWEIVERIPAARTGRFANRVIEACHGLTDELPPAVWIAIVQTVLRPYLETLS